MEIETHKLKKQNGRIEIFRRNNNSNEIYSLAIQLIKIVSFFTFILLGGIILFQTNEQSISMMILLLVILFLIWILVSEITDLIVTLKRNSKPILIIENSKVHIMNEYGNYDQPEISNIRSVGGRIYTKIKGVENPKIIYYSEIFLSLNNGNHLTFDVINSSKLFRPLAKDSIKEIRLKSKSIGSFIAKKLNVQFFMENKINTAANNGYNGNTL